MSDQKIDPERDESGPRSLFGDGVVVLPEGKRVEGDQLFALLVHVGVEIFERVFAETKEMYRKKFEGFRGSKISFLSGHGSWGWCGVDIGEFKIEVEIEDHTYGGLGYIKWLIFRLYMNLDDSGNNEWTEIKQLESSEYKPFWEKFLRLKEALLSELSK